jgi:hypothetical protein
MAPSSGSGITPTTASKKAIAFGIYHERLPAFRPAFTAKATPASDMHPRFNGLVIDAASASGGEGGIANVVWPSLHFLRHSNAHKEKASKGMWIANVKLP